jgi:hypothetical protein
MINKQIRLQLFSIYTLLAIAVFSLAWFYGADTVINNIKVFEKGTAPICQDVLNSVNGFSVFVYGASSFYIATATVLFSGLFLSGAFLYDKNSGFGNICITRIGYDKYFCKKIIAIFLSSFISVAMILSMIFIVCLFVFSTQSPSELFNADMADTKITLFFFSHPYILSFAVIFTISLQASLLTILGLCFSFFSSNRFIVGVLPFALFLFFIVFPQMFERKSNFGKYLAWIFPQYFSEFFTSNQFWYTELSLPAVYCVHVLILLTPTIALLILLYQKNRKSYIK